IIPHLALFSKPLFHLIDNPLVRKQFLHSATHVPQDDGFLHGFLLADDQSNFTVMINRLFELMFDALVAEHGFRDLEAGVPKFAIQGERAAAGNHPERNYEYFDSIEWRSPLLRNSSNHFFKVGEKSQNGRRALAKMPGDKPAVISARAQHFFLPSRNIDPEQNFLFGQMIA